MQTFVLIFEKANKIPVSGVTLLKSNANMKPYFLHPKGVR